MKISLTWLQTYFEQPLPSAEAISDAFTFHAFEIDEMQGDMLDVKVLPNRAADCLSHRGLARELGAILDLPLKADPLREPLQDFPQSEKLKVEIADPQKCLRYMGALVRGVKVGPSPEWLKEALESVGQRSINNVVDATNYVMLNIGQPLHAFDAAKLVEKDGMYAIGVREAKESEKITTLSGDEYALSPNILLITDAHADAPIALAGVKGGKAAELTADTTDIIVESANFDGTTTRRAAQALKLFTDASVRFQNRPSPELAAYGMRDVLTLITQIAGGEVEGVVDEYPMQAAAASVSVSHARVNDLLGTRFTIADIEEVFRRLGLPASVENDVFTVTPPFERTDLVIAEDLVEEVGRTIGYEHVAPQELSAPSAAPDQARYRGIERMKDQLVEQGFIEVSTQSFAKKGDFTLANPLDKNMPALRMGLEENIADALKRAKQYAPLVLAPKQKPKLFEVGTVFPKEGEFVELRMSERVPEWGEAVGTFDNLSIAKLEDYGKDYAPVQYELSAYKPFSLYPFIVRDIALWVPSGTEASAIEEVIRMHASALLVRLDQFDHFEKEGRVSYAFKLVFQSFDRTLTDDEVNTLMTAITAALTEKGYEVR
ncbi:MAG: phenylalanine--tRNA ligase subunit beta [Candidatus Paceibacteria bacterium]